MAIPELNTSVFIIPKSNAKNSEDRLVILNELVKKVVEEVRGIHPEYVFIPISR
ncbi:hypothetical protein [Coxiella-like endosymbiont]|uniref:hypothetical protein n=1 Tax=Coxiella-like endosymbiont TaxID=1592897 RepID=UPI00272C762A|nr:hypothetical protein [Coxiella-like endosymbiont]